MSYPEKNAGYRNKPAWLDRAVAAERPSEQDRIFKDAMDAQGREAIDISDAVPRRAEGRADGGRYPGGPSIGEVLTRLGERALKDTTQADDRQTNETMPSFSSLKGIQGREAQEISDAVPRRGMKRAVGGMTNARLAQVAPEFEPAAAQDAREAAGERVRRAQRLKTMNNPKTGLDPEL